MTFEEQLAQTGRLIYTNKGFSMLPLLRENRDVMVIEAVRQKGASETGGSGSTAPGIPVSELKRLDAVLFVRPHMEGRGHYVIHRILRVNPDGTYWIIGDNCVDGETVKPENVIGRLESVVRNGKQISMTDPQYLRQVRIWWAVFPIRVRFRKAKSLFFKCGSFVKRRVLRIR